MMQKGRGRSQRWDAPALCSFSQVSKARVVLPIIQRCMHQVHSPGKAARQQIHMGPPSIRAARLRIRMWHEDQVEILGVL